MNACLYESGERMDSGDRLSSLPDELLHKILSSFNIRDVIRLGVLSSRWRFIWTSMSCLKFSTEDFSTIRKFSNFATHVLSHRNNLTQVYSVKLKYPGKTSRSQKFVKRILKYSFSHNIQQLKVVCWIEKHVEFPLSLFCSESLKHLSLKMQSQYIDNPWEGGFCYFTSAFELPQLTTLVLERVFLCDDEAEKCVGVFSKCPNLQNLIISVFGNRGSKSLSIVHPRLSNLTLEYAFYNDTLKVIAPQLKNLRIIHCYGKHVVSAPNLTSLVYNAYVPLCLSTKGFRSLEKAVICIHKPMDNDVHQIVCLLQLLHNVKFLTLNLEIVEILSSSVDLILQQPSPFVNLMSLKIYPVILHRCEDAPKKVTTMSTELKSYLLDGSPNSNFTILLREEIKAMKIMIELEEILAKEESKAQKIMAELGVILAKEKDNIKINRTHLERGKTVVGESHKLKIGGNMTRIKSCWEDLGMQLRYRKQKAYLIISKLQDLEELQKKLPASKRAKIQLCFSYLCAEADIIITQIQDCMKIHCNDNQSLSSVRSLLKYKIV